MYNVLFSFCVSMFKFVERSKSNLSYTLLSLRFIIHYNYTTISTVRIIINMTHHVQVKFLPTTLIKKYGIGVKLLEKERYI